MLKILRNISQLAVCPNNGGQAEIGLIPDAALVWDGDSILWVGEAAAVPADFSNAQSFDAGGRLVIPGLIDCHTHLVFAGWRADEFAMRVLGKTYAEIAAAGGGILSTVSKTRAASEEELCKRALGVLHSIQALGVTTIEGKSGYGLNTESELKILRVYKMLRELQEIDIVPTFLGAHTFPPEYKDRRHIYVDLIINEMLPMLSSQRLAEFCDVFVDDSAFSINEATEILSSAKKLGLGLKVHADQFRDDGGASFAASMKAVSAEHLEYSSEEGIGQLAENGVVAILLPFASLYTHGKAAEGRRFVNAGLKVAVSTDFNPGSAPVFDLPLCMTLACTLNRLTPAEALKAATIYAACALKRENSLGSLEKGKKADFALIDAPSVEHWLYHFREGSCFCTVKNGRVVHGSLANQDGPQ